MAQTDPAHRQRVNALSSTAQGRLLESPRGVRPEGERCQACVADPYWPVGRVRCSRGSCGCWRPTGSWTCPSSWRIRGGLPTTGRRRSCRHPRVHSGAWWTGAEAVAGALSQCHLQSDQSDQEFKSNGMNSYYIILYIILLNKKTKYWHLWTVMYVTNWHELHLLCKSLPPTILRTLFNSYCLL